MLQVRLRLGFDFALLYGAAGCHWFYQIMASEIVIGMCNHHGIGTGNALYDHFAPLCAFYQHVAAIKMHVKYDTYASCCDSVCWRAAVSWGCMWGGRELCKISSVSCLLSRAGLLFKGFRRCYHVENLNCTIVTCLRVTFPNVCMTQSVSGCYEIDQCTAFGSAAPLT